MEEAAARAVATAGGAVVFAGGTVVIALCSLAVARIPIVSALGYSAAVVVLIAVITAITLLPALLATLGTRINSLRVPFLRTASARPQASRLGEVGPRGRQAGRRERWCSGSPSCWCWRSRCSTSSSASRTTVSCSKSTTTRQAYDLLTRGFGPGRQRAALIAVDFDGSPAHPDNKQLKQVEQQQQQAQQQAVDQAAQQLEAEGVPPDEAQSEAEQQVKSQPPTKKEKQASQQEAFLKTSASDPRLVKLENKIAKTKGVKDVSPAQVDKSGDTAVFTVTPTTAPSADATEDLVRRLRSPVIPDALKGTPLAAYVGGQTAGYIDLGDRISERLPLVIATVIVLSFLLLLIAFRSIVVPLTAGLMNLLSVGAAYGILTFVFQEGHGAKLLGPRRAQPDRQLRAAVDVRDPVRALDGLPGVPADQGPGALPEDQGQPRGGGRRARASAPG